MAGWCSCAYARASVIVIERVGCNVVIAAGTAEGDDSALADEDRSAIASAQQQRGTSDGRIEETIGGRGAQQLPCHPRSASSASDFDFSSEGTDRT
jgi:hypothetical protein